MKVTKKKLKPIREYEEKKNGPLVRGMAALMKLKEDSKKKNGPYVRGMAALMKLKEDSKVPINLNVDERTLAAEMVRRKNLEKKGAKPLPLRKEADSESSYGSSSYGSSSDSEEEQSKFQSIQR